MGMADLEKTQSSRACHTTTTEQTLPMMPFVRDTKLWEETYSARNITAHEHRPLVSGWVYAQL